MGLQLSVVVATFNRRALLTRLIEQLSAQTLDPSRYGIVVVDDGSTEPATSYLNPTSFAPSLTVLRQDNAGAAAARHRGILAAHAPLLVITDDDMQVPNNFLERHLAAHAHVGHRVVMGRICADPNLKDMPLFERWYAYRLDTIARQLAAGSMQLNGSALYTGNVSLRRDDYLAVGGFDPSLARSEDAELGLRLEARGVPLHFAADAVTLHGSDHTSEQTWLKRAFVYGVCDSLVRAKHPTMIHADPWRFLFKTKVPARPLLAAAAIAPNATKGLTRALLRAVHFVDSLGLARAAYAGSAVAYSMEYFRGVRHAAGSLTSAVDAFAHHLGLRRQVRKGGAHVQSIHM